MNYYISSGDLRLFTYNGIIRKSGKPNKIANNQTTIIRVKTYSKTKYAKSNT